MRRNENRAVITNDHPMYAAMIEARGRKFIQHHAAANMEHPDAEDLRNIGVITHMWTHGDRFWKLAARYYGNVEHWWVIAWYNQKPTDHDVALGDRIDIPTPLEDIIKIFGV